MHQEIKEIVECDKSQYLVLLNYTLHTTHDKVEWLISMFQLHIHIYTHTHTAIDIETAES